MKTSFPYQARALLVAAVLPFGAAFASESPSLLLQKGIYAEEIERNLDSAIKIYQQIAAEAATQRAIAAQAQYRLALCYQKKGSKEQAVTALNDFLRKFPTETELERKARDILTDLGQAPANAVTTRQILGKASNAYGVLTADGKHVRSLNSGNGDVIQFNMVSGQMNQIKNTGGWSDQDRCTGSHVWSPDGKQIVFNTYADDWTPQLRIRNLDGSDLRTLLEEKKTWVLPLDWSLDAASVLTVRYVDQAIELTQISTADGSIRVLRRIAGEPQRARFSPDGQFIAYSLERPGSPLQSDIFLMASDGQNEVAVAEHPAEDKLLRWTPDGRGLIFLSDRSGTWDLWFVSVLEGKQHREPVLLKKNLGWDVDVLGFAPDGSLYYRTIVTNGRLHIGEVDLETGKVLVPPMPVMTRYTSPPASLTWSPDGRNLAYVSRAGRMGPGNNIVTIRSAETGEERFLPGSLSRPWISWAPDSRSVIAYARDDVIRIETETNAINRLAKGNTCPRLCPDGKTLVHTTGKGIRTRNLETDELSVIVRAFGDYDLSPDGREVVFQGDGNPRSVKAVSINGGEPRELFRSQAYYYGLQWTRDGRNIIALAYPPKRPESSEPAQREIWRISAQGGTSVKLELAPPGIYSFDLNLDNRRFAFSTVDVAKSELWVLENFLPAARVASNP